MTQQNAKTSDCRQPTVAKDGRINCTVDVVRNRKREQRIRRSNGHLRPPLILPSGVWHDRLQSRLSTNDDHRRQRSFLQPQLPRYKPKFHLARHVTSRHISTRHDTFDALCPCRTCRTDGSTRSSRRARHVERAASRRDVTCVYSTRIAKFHLAHHVTSRLDTTQRVERVETSVSSRAV